MNNYQLEVDDGLLMREAGPWVIEKLDYLNRYIDIFETAMKNKFSTRFYVDLLSGPGKNRIRGTESIVLGSPLVALATKYPFTHYIFNEYDKSCFIALQKRCQNITDQNIQLFNGDCNNIVDNIVQLITSSNGESLNLAFIDPEGFEVNWRTICTLAEVKRMDLLMYYPQMGLNKNLKNFVNCEDECLIDSFFGTAKWREIYKHLESKNQVRNIHRELINLYKENLSKLGYIEILSDLDIGSEPLIRNAERNAPLYRLLFASKNKLGKEFWNKITKRDVYGQRRLL